MFGLRYFAKRNETKWYFAKWYFAKWYFAKWYFAKWYFAKWTQLVCRAYSGIQAPSRWDWILVHCTHCTALCETKLNGTLRSFLDISEINNELVFSKDLLFLKKNVWKNAQL